MPSWSKASWTRTMYVRCEIHILIYRCRTTYGLTTQNCLLSCFRICFKHLFISIDKFSKELCLLLSAAQWPIYGTHPHKEFCQFTRQNLCVIILTCCPSTPDSKQTTRQTAISGDFAQSQAWALHWFACQFCLNNNQILQMPDFLFLLFCNDRISEI